MELARLRLALVVAVPGLVLAVAGQSHPHLLTVSSAHDWWTLHVYLLPVFPFLAGALALLLRGDQRPIAWAARLAGFGFAVGYTALDAIDGIGAGLVVEAAGAPQDVITGRIFEIGDRIGRAGIWSLVAAMLLTVGALWATRRRVWLLVALPPYLYGCHLFYDHHIFAPEGVRAMLLLALGTALLALAPLRRPAVVTTP